MQRRSFITKVPAALAAGWLLGTPARAAIDSPPIDAVAEIKALRIPSGPYAGGYELAPNGGLNWYFANLGLVAIVPLLGAADLQSHVLPYLNLYLANVKAALKNMAYRNLALTAKPSGLTSVFQSPRSQSNSSGYLMDNCEGYRGLRDFAALLRSRSELHEANYYDLLASNTAEGVSRFLFKAPAQAFLSSDAAPALTADFYPGTTCQVYPQAFGLRELAGQSTAGWNYFNTHTPGWETGSHDPFPWAILGYVAALRGQTGLASAQLATIDKLFAANRRLVTINELGFYQRTKSVLAGNLSA